MSQVRKKYPSYFRGRHWCLTLNNPMEDDGKFIEGVMDYLIVGKEVGESGTRHLQMYVVFSKRKSLKQVKGFFPRSHIELMLGTPTQASVYCQKEGKYEEFGKLPKTAAEASSVRCKRRWDEAYELAKAGKLEEIEKSCLVPYYHAFKRIEQDNPRKPKDLETVCGLWFYGKTGSGKSYKARKDYPDYYDKPLNKWWTGYRGEKNVIVDDIDSKQAPWIGSFLKRWGDRYSFPIEEKGGGKFIRPEKIIVTSQHRIEHLFFGLEGDAIARRFTEYHIRRKMWWKDNKYITDKSSSFLKKARSL